MLLTDKEFSNVLKNTPLVSIDLVVFNTSGQVLLGKRTNRPAQGYWFVPGGRILKNEPLQTAFERLTVCELGKKLDYSHSTLLGAYDHFYQDSIFGDAPSTHYVALAHKVTLKEELELPKQQHSEYRWFSIAELLTEETVHENTRAYFQP